MPQTQFFVISGHFLLFYSTNNPKNQNLEKIKNILSDIILNLFTKNDYHMMYGSGDMKRVIQNFLSFQTIVNVLSKIKVIKI